MLHPQPEENDTPKHKPEVLEKPENNESLLVRNIKNVISTRTNEMKVNAKIDTNVVELHIRKVSRIFLKLITWKFHQLFTYTKSYSLDKIQKRL